MQVVAPVNIKFTLGSSAENIYGIDFQSYNALRPFVFVSGGPFKEDHDLIIDDLQAKLGQGASRSADPVKVLNHMFTVCGIVEHGKGSAQVHPTDDDGRARQ